MTEKCKFFKKCLSEIEKFVLNLFWNGRLMVDVWKINGRLMVDVWKILGGKWRIHYSIFENFCQVFSVK